MKRIIVIGLFIAVLVATGVYLYVFHKPARTASKEKAQYSVSVKELVAAFETDENAANAKYLNKVIKVNGIIGNISESENEISVGLKDPDEMAGVTCSFDKDEFDKSKLIPGQRVFIKGICSGYLMDVILNKCALDVEAEK